MKELKAELDSLEHGVRARIAMTTPSEPESINKLIAQQKSTLDRLSVLEPKYQSLQQQVHDLVAMDTETPAIAALQSEQNEVDKQWEVVKLLSELYMKK